MGGILLVPVALFVLLVIHGADASRSYPTNEHADAKFHTPVNETNSIRRLIGQPSNPEGNTTMTHLALYNVQSILGGYYHGFIGTMDVYAFTLKPGQGSETSFSLANPGDDRPTPSVGMTKGMTIGWHVLPDVYGDSHTHLFTLWTNDGFQSTGCLNTKCPGFQAEKGAAIAPGDIIEHVSYPKGAKQNLNLKIIKDSTSGDWLVHVGLNREPELIGRFPRSLFTGYFANRATAVRFGGTATKPAPMGSGYLPADGKSAASISNIHIIDQKGLALPLTEDLPGVMTDSTVYALSHVVNGSFFYGGPWKATA
ncbi:hypothetical protein ACP70R_043877 [Stipagrostis hirtigluma subsp. patula]